ncbi:MAG: DNA-binding protein [Lachnospiraceae bacterium]|nr:DNA-binding protein [Lachnospiraceae bacterium]
MDRIIAQGRLYDFYGELLTPHQRSIYEAAVYDDMSLAEIAERESVSRQAVHDIIKRATRLLEDYENKLHMIERYDRITGLAQELKKDAAKEGLTSGELKECMTKAADAIIAGMT